MDFNWQRYFLQQKNEMSWDWCPPGIGFLWYDMENRLSDKTFIHFKGFVSMY